MSAKYAQQSMILTYQIFCILKHWSLQGTHDTLLPSMSKTFRKIHFTNWSDYPHFKKELCMLLYEKYSSDVMFIHWANC